MECSQEGLTVSEFFTKLKQIVPNCEFGELQDSLMKSKLTCGLTSEELRTQLPRDPDITLDKVVGMCICHEEIKKTS